MIYELYYWPGIRDGAEFVASHYEEAGAEYIDVALIPEEKKAAEIRAMELLEDESIEASSIRSPVLKAGGN